jgi:AcrR family transcriptional regulator
MTITNERSTEERAERRRLKHPSPPPKPSPMELRLCDAALACIERSGLAKTTLEDVAAEAEVSRQTIYRYFANRDELLLDALLLELQRNQGPDPLDESLADIHTSEDAVEALVVGAVFTIESIRRNPKLSALLVTEGDSVRSTLAGASELLFRHHADDLRPWLALGQKIGFLNPDLDPDEMAEWLLRVTLSLLTEPGLVERDSDQLHDYLKAYLTPVFAGPGPRRARKGRP